MATFITIYLMIGFYFAFMIYYELSETGITGSNILSMLPDRLATWLFEHSDAYVLLILFLAIGIVILWPYVIYLMWRNKNE